MVLSRKLITAVVANVLTDGVALAVAHFGLHVSSAEAVQVSAYVGVVASFVAGFLVKEIPDL